MPPDKTREAVMFPRGVQVFESLSIDYKNDCLRTTEVLEILRIQAANLE